MKGLEKLIGDKALINEGGLDRRSPLHIAASEGQLAVVEFLLEQKADPNVTDRFGRTPLEDAVVSKSQDVITLLRSKGAVLGDNVNLIHTLMCEAAAAGDAETVKNLLDAGADPNAANFDLRTALHVAASEGRVETAEILIKHGAEVNPVDRFGNTPLLDAQRRQTRGTRAVVKILREYGATVDAPDFTGPALQVALTNAMPILCQRGGFSYAEVFIPSNDGAEFVHTGWHCEKELLPVIESIQPEVARIEFSESGSGLYQAYSSRQAKVLTELQPKEAAMEQVGLDTVVVIPVYDEASDKVHALFRIFVNSGNPFLEAEQLEAFGTFVNRIIDAGVYRTQKAPVFAEPRLASGTIPKGQMEEVYMEIVNRGVFSPVVVYHEVDWFYNMGLQSFYFNRFSAHTLAKHIHSFIAAKLFATSKGQPEDIWLTLSDDPKLLKAGAPAHSIWMVPQRHTTTSDVEKKLQNKVSTLADQAYAIDHHQSARPFRPGGTQRLAVYVLQTSQWANPKATKSDKLVWEVASEAFLASKTKAIRDRYQEILDESVDRLSNVARVFPEYRDGTIPIMFSFNQGSGNAASYLRQLTELLKQGEIECRRKFVETFRNGIVMFTVYIEPASQEQISALLKRFSMLHLVPSSPLTDGFLQGEYSAEEYTYLSAVQNFVYYFINQRSEEFEALSQKLKDDSINLGRLRLMHTTMKRDTVSHNRILEVMQEHPEIAQELYKDFERRVTTNQRETPVPPNNALLKKMGDVARTPLEKQILVTMLTGFNYNVVKTNFFKRRKSALSFRMSPEFLRGDDWPELPYGIFYILGPDFQGFHVRFRDVSRGGIRLIVSRSAAAEAKNLSSLFAEIYALSYTQNKKNKDIPEFGSKGAILMRRPRDGAPQDTFLAFKRYTSSMLDCVIPHPDIVDNHGKPEALFFGPDEGTASYMEWATHYARRKGYGYWRAITTGKPPSLGGIPHDTYGMTTNSVHQYVLGVIRKLGLNEADLTKCQTGGPDGDLGSNEILISKDKTKAVVDGSGVLYDPEGIDREALTLLAKNRQMISEFDTSKLSPGGFRVLVTDSNVTLPSGEVVERGMTFRNDFHLHPLFEADLFVPCGGRPESVNLSNVKHFLVDDGKGGLRPKFKYIIEGANLFFTQDARMVLEEHGVILYKDASTNKGGVTCSSLEVFAALALGDADFQQHMCVKDPKNPPKFYQEYVDEVLVRIREAADLEFEAIWQEHERTGIPRHILTDQLSDKINTMTDFVGQSKLWDDLALRERVLLEALPKTLVNLVGLEEICKNAPESYLHAMFSSHLASRYVYAFGVRSNEFSFFEFMSRYVAPEMSEQQKA